MNRPVVGYLLIKRPTTGPLCHSFLELWQCKVVQNAEKREKRRRLKKNPTLEFVEKKFILGSSRTSRNFNKSKEENERYRIRRSSFSISYTYNHLLERKMVETRNTDATLFNIIFRKFVEILITILVTFTSIIFFVQKFTGDDFRTIKDQAREKCDILEKLSIRRSRRKNNVEAS